VLEYPFHLAAVVF